MSDDRLSAMLEDIRAFVREREWEPFHDPKNLAMAVASEAGELLAELRWVEGGEADAHCQREPERGQVADEMADVAIGLFMLADRIGLDLPSRVHDKLSRLRLKYPAELERQKSR
jgi:NTP pyrophosphatase (non-canonical NTP hydrolase)